MNPDDNSANFNPTSSNASTSTSTTNNQGSNANNEQAPIGFPNLFLPAAQGFGNTLYWQLIQRLLAPNYSGLPLWVPNPSVPSDVSGQMLANIARNLFPTSIRDLLPEQYSNQPPISQVPSTVDPGAMPDAAIHPVASTSRGTTHGHSSHVRDSSWLKLPVCLLYIAGNMCPKSRDECDFAHPESNVIINGGMVTVCFDHMKRGKCHHPNCKYFHVSARQKAIVETQGSSNRTPIRNTNANVTVSPDNGGSNSATSAGGGMPQVVTPQQPRMWLPECPPSILSTPTTATSSSFTQRDLIALLQCIAANALQRAAHLLGQMMPTANFVPYLLNTGYSLGNQIVVENPSTVSTNLPNLGNQLQYGGQNFPTYIIPALPANLNLQQLQSLLVMSQSNTPQPYPFGAVPVAFPIIPQVPTDCKRASGNDTEESMACRNEHSVTTAEEILEKHRCQCIKDTVQSSNLSDTSVLLVNASHAEVVAVSDSASDDDAGVPATVNNPTEALSSASDKAEGDSEDS